MARKLHAIKFIRTHNPGMSLKEAKQYVEDLFEVAHIEGQYKYTAKDLGESYNSGNHDGYQEGWREGYRRGYREGYGDRANLAALQEGEWND